MTGLQTRSEEEDSMTAETILALARKELGTAESRPAATM